MSIHDLVEELNDSDLLKSDSDEDKIYSIVTKFYYKVREEAILETVEKMIK